MSRQPPFMARSGGTYGSVPANRNAGAVQSGHHNAYQQLHHGAGQIPSHAAHHGQARAHEAAMREQQVNQRRMASRTAAGQQAQAQSDAQSQADAASAQQMQGGSGVSVFGTLLNGIQIISDVHLEFDETLDYLPRIVPRARVLALLGDIGYPGEAVYREFLLSMADQFEHVLVIAGNHEYYTAPSYKEANTRILAICQERRNLHMLHRTTLEMEGIFPGVRFLGTTLWTHVPDADAQYITETCNDYSNIKVTAPKKGQAPRALRVGHTNRMHAADVDWLRKEIERAAEDGKKVIILTHHAPTGHDTMEEDVRGTQLERMEYTNLEALFQPEHVVAWAFGHTHYNSDQVLHGCRVVSNQFGYTDDPEEGLLFDPLFVLNPMASVADHKADLEDRIAAQTDFRRKRDAFYAQQQQNE